MWKAESLAGRAVWAAGEALYNGVDKQRHETVKRLLGQGVDPNDDAQRGHGAEKWTPLHRAAAHGDEELIDALLRAGANVNAMNQRMSTPLHLAAWAGHTDAVRQLLLAGADPATKTNRNEMVREVAAKMGHTDVMRAIDEHYAFIKARVNADRSRAKENYDRQRAINSACRLAKESLAKGDAAWATQIVERGLLNDPNHEELLDLLHKAEVQQLAERTFAAEEKVQCTGRRLHEVGGRLERSQELLRQQAFSVQKAEERAAAAEAAQAAMKQEQKELQKKLAEAEQSIAALKGDRDHGRCKVQVRWGLRGQWVSFKTTRDVEILILKSKFAEALHVSLDELMTMDLQWRDEQKDWWLVLDTADVADILKPPSLNAADAASGVLTEKELLAAVKNNKSDKALLFQLVPVHPSNSTADAPTTFPIYSRQSIYSRPHYEQVEACVRIQKWARGRSARRSKYGLYYALQHKLAAAKIDVDKLAAEVNLLPDSVR